jgi:surface antigen
MSDCAAVRLRLVLFAVVISIVILPSRNTSAQSGAATVAAPTINGPELTSSAYLPGPVQGGKPTGDQYPWGQCTWYAWGRAKENDDVSLKPFGNATDWAAAISSQQPRAHSIAVWQNAIKGDGHVAYVEKVEGDKIFITEANFYNFRSSLDNYAKDYIGGGFDGCHILTKAQMAKRPVAQKVEKTEGDLILRGYIYLPVASSSASSGPIYTCSPLKDLRVSQPRGFSHAQNGNQVTLTFRGEGFQQGAKVIAQGIDWTSDEISVTSITPDGKELVAVLGVQDSAKFTVAIQNPDMERSKPQEFSVAAAPPVQVANSQPVPTEEPASTPATAPDVPSAAVLPTSTAVPETAAPATSAEPTSANAPQQVTISPAAAAQPTQQPAENSTPIQAPAQAPEQVSAAQQSAAPADQPAAEAAGQAPAASATSMAPVLLRITPGNHAPGQFTVDLYGLNFQEGAKIVVQGIDWSSDQAAVNFLGANHLQATIVAQNAAQITIAVQNPDAQTSGTRRFVIGQPQARIATSGPAAGTAPTTTNAAIATPSTTGAAPATSPTGATPGPSTPVSSASAATGASPGTTSAQPPTTPAAGAPATAAGTSAASPATSATKNPTSAATGNKSPISPLLPRGGTTDAGSTIAVVPISAASTGATPSATPATKNPATAAIAPKVPISPLLPRGRTTNAGSTIAVSPTSASGASTVKSPIMPSPVSATQQGLSFCGRSIAPLPQQDISAGACGKYLEGQCVAYARCRSGYSGSVPGGDARNWPANQPDHQKVQAGDVVIFSSGEFGHVAYVESVNRDASGRVTEVNVSEANYGGKLVGFPNLAACGVTKRYGVVDNRTVSLNDFQGVYHPANAPGQFLPPLSTGSPVLRVSTSSLLKSGDSVDIVGENFTRNSRVSLLLTAPGSAETFLVSFTSDPNGGFHYPYSAACDAKAGAYSIRALDQAPAGSGVTGRKSSPLALNVSGKATHCVLGIPAAVASSKPSSAPAPVLNPVTPASHPAGQFSIDLYGSGFQPGAKVLVQAANGQSGQASVTYLGSDHLRAVITAPNPSQFTMAVQNPDSQMSAAHPFQITPSTAVSTKSGQVPAIVNPPRSPVSAPSTLAPVGAPANAGSTAPSVHSTNPITATPLNTPTPLKQPVIVNSTPVQPNHGSPVVSAPQIKPTPIPVQTIKPMPLPQPNVASYPANTNTAKPVLHPPSSTTPMSTPSQMPGSTIPAAPGIKPAGPPASGVNTVRPTSPPMAPPHPTPAPVVKAQPQPFTPPVRVAPTPTPLPRTYSPPPPAPRTLPQPTPVPHAYTPPPPPPRAVPQPTPVPQPTKTPTPKKP